MGRLCLPWLLVSRVAKQRLSVGPAHSQRGLLTWPNRPSSVTGVENGRCFVHREFNSAAHFCTTSGNIDTTGAELNTAKTIYRQYLGGTVDLIKDPTTGIAVITLNNPPKKNALTGSMMVQLSDVVSDLEHWEEGKGVILRGADKFFCSGAELDMVRDTLQIQGRSLLMATLMHDVTSRVAALPMVSLALIEGAALGGGAELSTCCDFRIATDSTKICFLQVKLGVVTGFGGGTRLVHILGRTKALDLLCSSRTLSATDAEDFGFVNSVLPNDTSEETMGRAKQWISRFCQGESLPHRSAKTIVHTACMQTIGESLQKEKDLFTKVWGNPSHRKVVGL